jgi:hypothetical protein
MEVGQQLLRVNNCLGSKKNGSKNVHKNVGAFILSVVTNVCGKNGSMIWWYVTIIWGHFFVLNIRIIKG